MSGTTSLCLQQQWNNLTGKPLVGGLLYSFIAGTLAPQNAYRSAALTVGTEFPNPVTLDASGRVPQMFYADGSVRLLLTDKNGVAQFDYDNVPVIGSSGGGGGVDTTDVNRLFGTGDMKLNYGTGALVGYVRGNKKTIGSSTSGATEFADATAQALFQWFWNRDANLPVTPGGRGASAVADWTANKQIETPDFRGVVIGGLDGMGNSLASRLTVLTFTGLSPDTLGALGGAETKLIASSHLPAHTHPVDIPAGQGSHAHAARVPLAQQATLAGTAGGPPATNTNPTTVTVDPAVLPAMGGTAQNNAGGGNPLPHVPPTRLVTVYFRL